MKTDTTAIKEAIKKEAYYHDQWDECNLIESVIHSSTKEASRLIDEFNRYDLPSSAVVGEWQLPDWYIAGNNSPKAPYWSFSFSEFTAYIKSVTLTDDPDILEIEYRVYRSNPAHCSGYYHYWDNGKAMVNTKTHRRWNVA